MPEIIVCFKWIVDEAYIRRGSAGDLDFSSVDYKISDYDRNAIEEAVRLKGIFGSSVTAVTVGTTVASKGVKDALSRGVDQAWFAADESFGRLDSTQTAAILADIIQNKIRSYDLIICGEGSGDIYAQQVGPRLAEYLGIPCVSFIQKLTIEGEMLVAERKVEEGIEVVSVQLPALVTVLSGINIPRIPGVRDTLMAGKKPVTTLKKDELKPVGEPLLKTIGFTAARLERNCERFGTDNADIVRFAGMLRMKGIVG